MTRRLPHQILPHERLQIINQSRRRKIKKTNTKRQPMISAAIALINKKFEEKKRRNIWENCKWANISKLEKNDVGVFGEELIGSHCKIAGIDANIDGTKTKEKGGGSGDGKIKGYTVEIKTARIGTNKKGECTTFQHDFNRTPWKADYIIFLDISAEKMYIIIFKNWSKEFWKKSGRDSKIKCGPCFPTKSVTWRYNCTGNFKFDTNIKINECCPKSNCYTIDNEATDYSKFKEFVDSIIP